MKHSIIYTILCLIGFLAFFNSCSENTVGEDLTVIKGLDYYPMFVGKYIIYEADSIIYRSESGGVCTFARDTSHFFLKEEVVDIFTDNTGKENYILERFIKYDINDPWVVMDVWNTYVGDSHVERVEENLRFIKMVFPVSEGIRWNGNSFFRDTTLTLAGEVIEFYKHWTPEYEYTDIDIPESFNGIEYDSVSTIVQSAPSENKINHRYSLEKYARGVGLVYKEMRILDTQCCEFFPELGMCDGIPWEEKAEKGLIYRQSVIDHN